tara:strand:+ start:706 stop:861 length:156 start_codon:yes stop_codon:yes gene_type:complete
MRDSGSEQFVHVLKELGAAAQVPVSLSSGEIDAVFTNWSEQHSINFLSHCE